MKEGSITPFESLGVLQADGTFLKEQQEEAKKTGVPTGDTENVVLFTVMGMFALVAAGYVYKAREN